MPYISKEDRKMYDVPIRTIMIKWNNMDLRNVAGHFTYVMYKLLQCFSGKFWMRALGIGCLICAILEIYRKEHSYYEDEQIRKSGDV